MIGNDAPEGGRDADGAELGGVRLIFVETEKVSVDKVRTDGWMQVSVVNALEEVADGFVDGGSVAVGNAYEDIKGVAGEAVGFATLLSLNGADDVPR